MTDITESKKAEIKIAEEAVRRRVLIEQSSDGIVILDRDGNVFEANLKYAEMLGYLLEEVLSLHIWDWDIQFTRDELEDMRSDVDENGDHFETIHRRKDGTLFDVEISSNAAMFGGTEAYILRMQRYHPTQTGREGAAECQTGSRICQWG
ncbi:MAG: PAS domain S-box protein [Methanosarcinaceae archaeon]|nr:PAS domain S-box protein [Methanosarcinaceae archaeon]